MRVLGKVHLPFDLTAPADQMMMTDALSTVKVRVMVGGRSRLQMTANGICHHTLAQNNIVYVGLDVLQHWKHSRGLDPHTVIIQGTY